MLSEIKDLANSVAISESPYPWFSCNSEPTILCCGVVFGTATKEIGASVVTPSPSSKKKQKLY